MAAKDVIFMGIGGGTSPQITYLLTHGLAIGAVADEWTPTSPTAASWTAADPTAASWTAQDPTSATWTPV